MPGTRSRTGSRSMPDTGSSGSRTWRSLQISLISANSPPGTHVMNAHNHLFLHGVNVGGEIRW